MLGKSRKEELESMKDNIDICRNISQIEMIVERWMMR